MSSASRQHLILDALVLSEHAHRTEAELLVDVDGAGVLRRRVHGQAVVPAHVEAARR